MDEVLTAIAEAVSTLIIAFADSEEKNKLFGDMVPAAEAIQGAVGGMVVAAEQAVTIVDEEYRGQIKKTTDDLKDACQNLVNAAYLPLFLSFCLIFCGTNIQSKSRASEQRPSTGVN
jgi:hypothetical protein